MKVQARSSLRGAVTSAVLAAMMVLAQAGSAQEAISTFRQSCMSCHTIGGGRLVGPDLKNVEARQGRDWLVGFILDPKGVLASGDPYALQLKDEAGGVIMPPVVGLSRERAEAILDLIAAESILEASQFAGLDIGDEPFSQADIDLGKAIFRGDVRLENGGPSCLSCHTVDGLGGLGGGRLGPDLSRVYERLQGRKNLASWMLAPATETMQPVYAKANLTNDEILPLVAYLEDEARTGKEDTTTAQVIFLLLGLGGAVLGFVAADSIWSGRLRGVRRSLVRGAQ
jgi:mono/diheme cytochrome c family protein